MNDTVSAKPWYKEWFGSVFYHRLYNQGNENTGFPEKLLNHLAPPAGSRLLDSNCGRGQRSIRFAKKGFEVTGIDISQRNIEHANRYNGDNPEFFQHDLRLPFRMNYYNYIFNFFAGFGYFKTRRAHEDCIRTIASGLKPGGKFMIDYLNVHYAEDHLMHHEEKMIGETAYEIHRWHDDYHFYTRIKINDPSLTQPAEYTERFAKFSLGDFNDLLAFHGMQINEVYGDYQLNKYDIRKTPRMIILSSKK